jgi:hypothetical protein
VLTAAGGIGTYVTLDKRAQEQKKVAEENERRLQAEGQKAREDYQKALADIAALKQNLESATDEATRQKLQRQLDEATRRASTAARGATAKPSGPSAPAGRGKCAPGDPLCVE